MISGSGTQFRLSDKRSKVTAPQLPYVVAFSGGRTSAVMLRMILDAGVQPLVLFANTGKERDETLDFVHSVQTTWNVPVHWLEYRRVPTSEDLICHLKTERMRAYARRLPEMHWFEEVTYETAARHSDLVTPFDHLLEWMSVLPNPRARACTAQLKIRTMARYLWSIGVYSFVNLIGIRADEVDRAYDIMAAADRDKDVYFLFPLAERGITQVDVLQWWMSQQNDLRLRPYEGNCHLCFLKKKLVKQRLIREQPQYTGWWAGWEATKSVTAEKAEGCRWRIEKGHSIDELSDAAAKLTPEELAAIDDGTPAMECACTSGLAVDVPDGDE